MCTVIIETEVTRVIPGGRFKSFRTASLTMLLLVQSFGALLHAFYVESRRWLCKYFYFARINTNSLRKNNSFIIVFAQKPALKG